MLSLSFLLTRIGMQLSTQLNHLFVEFTGLGSLFFYGLLLFATSTAALAAKELTKETTNVKKL